MTSLSPSPLLVALVQAATMLPVALLAMPAGALADIVDRRLLLLAAQCAAVLAAIVLFVVTANGRVGPGLLLALTFAAACGTALSVPVLQAITSEIVPHSSLAHTVTLGGISNNIARIVGPVAGGSLVAFAGPQWVFLANGLSMLGVIFVIKGWKRKAPANRFPPEHMLGAVRAGFRYVHTSHELHSVMVRSLAFFLCASALWSLLPLVARQHLGLGPTGYGSMLTGIGAGAIISALSLQWLRARVTANKLSKAASLLMAGAVALVALSANKFIGVGAMVAVGAGWNLMTANLQSSALLEAAAWAKARTFGIYLMVFQGAMSVGAFVWGSLASEIGIAGTLLAAAALLGANLLLAILYPLIVDPSHDLEPSRHWPEPVLQQPLSDDDGPVLITIEYEIDLGRSTEFIAKLHRLGEVRLRDGAMRWRYWRDVTHSELVVETFIVASWVEHMRQHDRFTNSDRTLQEEVNSLHTGTSPPLVRHWIAIH